MMFIIAALVALVGGSICFVFDISGTWFNRLVYVAWFMLIPLFAVADDSGGGGRSISRLRK